MAKSGVKVTGISQLNKLQANLNRISQSEGQIKTGIKIKMELKDRKIFDVLKKKFPDAVQSAHKKSLVILAEELELALGIAMESKIWNWDYGDGDIVDTGALRDSVVIGVVNNNITIAYGEEYAAIVYYGGYIHPYGNSNVQIYMPGRPWIEAVITGSRGVPKFDFDGIYQKYFVGFLQSELAGISR